MVEAGGNRCPKKTCSTPSNSATTAAARSSPASANWSGKAGKPKRVFTPPAVDQELYRPDRGRGPRRSDRRDEHGEVREARKLSSRSPSSRRASLEALADEEQRRSRRSYFDALKERIFRDEMLKKHRRPDGRAFDEIRQITIEVGILPRTHGSALFTRGETQALVTATLGTKDDEQRIELLDIGRNQQALHAALQLPAVQRRRSRLHARPRPPRNRPRRAGRARALGRDPR